MLLLMQRSLVGFAPATSEYQTHFAVRHRHLSDNSGFRNTPDISPVLPQNLQMELQILKSGL